MTDTRTRLWVGLFVLVVFVAGVGAGIVAAPWLGRELPERGIGRGGPGRPAMSGRLVDRMSSRLDLSEEQSARLRALFDARRDRFRAVNREMRERLAAEQGSFRTAIADILTPAQMATFESEFLRMGARRGSGPAARDGQAAAVDRSRPRGSALAFRPLRRDRRLGPTAPPTT